MRTSRRRITLLMDLDHYSTPSNLVHNLNIRQDSFRFSLIPARGLGKRLARLKCSTEDLLAKVRQSHSRRGQWFPVLVTDAVFPKFRYAFMDTRRAMVMSLGGAAKLRREGDRRPFLCAMLADLLVSMFVNTPAHEECIGCVSDVPRTTAQLTKYLRAMRFCARCELIIDAAVRNGQLSERQKLAIESILDYGAARRRCFVLMPFKRSLLPVFKQLARTGESCGWTVERADDKLGDPHIMAAVLEGIRVADVLIADLTGAAPNVMYEVGFAHALERKVVLLTQHLRQVPFDVRDRRVHRYRRSDMAELSRMVRQYFAN